MKRNSLPALDDEEMEMIKSFGGRCEGEESEDDSEKDDEEDGGDDEEDDKKDGQGDGESGDEEDVGDVFWWKELGKWSKLWF
jgi:hypothetical protein